MGLTLSNTCPWSGEVRTTHVPDVGKFLYRHVHAQHHKSYLPTAFSGTNMHPVEARPERQPLVDSGRIQTV